MRIPSRRAGARAAALLLLTAVAALSAPALAPAQPITHAGALPAASSSPTAATRSLTVAVRDLPPGRRTLAQLAAYYYGSRTMSFVLTAANPRLAGVGADRNLATSRPGAAVRIPELRGARPLGPA
jgi:hypothetical protein